MMIDIPQFIRTSIDFCDGEYVITQSSPEHQCTIFIPEYGIEHFVNSIRAAQKTVALDRLVDDED